MNSTVPESFSKPWKVDQTIQIEATFTINKIIKSGEILDHVEATYMNSYLKIPHEFNLTRVELLTYLADSKIGVYYEGKRIIKIEEIELFEKLE